MEILKREFRLYKFRMISENLYKEVLGAKDINRASKRTAGISFIIRFTAYGSTFNLILEIILRGKKSIDYNLKSRLILP